MLFVLVCIGMKYHWAKVKSSMCRKSAGVVDHQMGLSQHGVYPKMIILLQWILGALHCWTKPIFDSISPMETSFQDVVDVIAQVSSVSIFLWLISWQGHRLRWNLEDVWRPPWLQWRPKSYLQVGWWLRGIQVEFCQGRCCRCEPLLCQWEPLGTRVGTTKWEWLG